VPVRVDHARADEVEALFARIREEQGRLDLLVANAWGGYEGEQNSFDAPFWEQPEWRFNRMLDAGLRAVEFLGRVIAALAADPYVLQRTGGIYRATDLAQSYGLALH
jgi:NAD(P)-dependent dehydrogenase (short-subunit alcohol dehydrogenase family)